MKETITSNQTRELLDFENKLQDLLSAQIGKAIPRWLVQSSELKEFARQASVFFEAYKRNESISTTFQ